MKGFDVLKIKSAVKNRNKFDLSRTHLTTMDFGQIVPMFVEETVPGDKFNVSAEFFSCMAPLVKPTYGKFSFKTVAGFVPYHQLAYDAEAWIAGKTTWEGIVPVQRYFTVGTLNGFVRDYCCTTEGATADNSEYTYKQANGDLVYNLFTPEGKYYVKILNALGYSISSAPNYLTSSSWYKNTRLIKLSAYPLLAFFKLYNDYMTQSTRYNNSTLTDFLNCIKYRKAYSGGWNEATGELLIAGLFIMFSNLFLNYDSDYFTSAWQNPNNPIATTSSIDTVTVPGTSTSIISDTVDEYIQSDLITGGSTEYVAIRQRALDFLKSFDNWVRRNNYSGSRAVQQIYSRFGIKTDDFKSHYAHVISTDSMPIQVGDVTATADSTNVPLGDYAGKGIMNGSESVSYDSSDYGVLLILGYFTVVPMNSFGADRRVLRSNPLDYYNPEFDGIGAEAISKYELFASPISTNFSASDQDVDVYGFTERYNSYRYGRDVISGEFRDYHADGDMNTWHTGRNLQTLRTSGALVAQSTSMNTLPQTGSEYNRIFSVTDDSVDHFYMTARFNVSAIRPMLNLNQVVNLGEGDTNVPRNGNVIS